MKCYESGQSLYKQIAREFNTYEATRYVDAYMAADRERFLAAWSVCGLELAYCYIRNGCNIWDKRKEASCQYAYMHIDTIKSVFTKYTGYSVDLDGVSDETSETFSTWFRHQLYLADGGNRRDPWLVALGDGFLNMHSTVKQSFFGGVVKVVFDKNARFPMI